MSSGIRFLLSVSLLLACCLGPALALKGDDQFASFVEDALMINRKAILKDLREVNAPFVKINDCIRGETLYSKDTVTFKPHHTVGKIHSSGRMYVGVLATMADRAEFVVPLNHIVKYFKEGLGISMQAVLRKYNSGEQMVDALMKGDIDLIHPGFHIDVFSKKRLKEIKSLCTPAGLEFSYYVKENKPGQGSPFKNMKMLLEEAKSASKKIVVFKDDIGSLLIKMYPNYNTTFTIKERKGDDLSYLTETEKYIAVFVHENQDPDKITASSAAIQKNYFVLPLMIYARSENPYIKIPADAEMEIYHQGNYVLRRLLDNIIADYQRKNAHFSYSVDDRSSTIGDCIGMQPSLPEIIKEVGIIQSIKSSSTLRVGYYKVASAVLTATNDGSSIVKGDFVAYEDKIFSKLAKYLQISNLQVVRKVFDSADSVLRALEDGYIDVTTGSMFRSDSIRTSYDPTCATAGFPIILYTPKKKNNDETIKSVKMLNKYLEGRKEKAKFAVASAALGNVLIDLLDHDIEIKVVDDDSQGFTETIENQKYVAYMPDYIVSVPSEFTSLVHRIDTGEFITTSMFLRKDRINKEDTSVSVLVVISIVMLCLFIGVLFFVLLFMLFKRFKNQPSVVPPIEIVDLDPSTEQSQGLLRDRGQSIGDDDDPDYIAPAF